MVGYNHSFFNGRLANSCFLREQGAILTELLNDPQAPPRTLTLTVDCGIFSNERSNLVAADPPLHLITWENDRS